MQDGVPSILLLNPKEWETYKDNWDKDWAMENIQVVQIGDRLY